LSAILALLFNLSGETASLLLIIFGIAAAIAGLTYLPLLFKKKKTKRPKNN